MRVRSLDAQAAGSRSPTQASASASARPELARSLALDDDRVVDVDSGRAEVVVPGGDEELRRPLVETAAASVEGKGFERCDCRDEGGRVIGNAIGNRAI